MSQNMWNLKWDFCFRTSNSRQLQTSVFFRDTTFYKEVKTPRDGHLCYYKLPVYMSVQCLSAKMSRVCFIAPCEGFGCDDRLLRLFLQSPPFPVPSTAVVWTSSDLGCTGTAQQNCKHLPKLYAHKLKNEKCPFLIFKLAAGISIHSNAAAERQHLTGTFPPHQVCIVSWNESQFPQYFFTAVCVL